jgi:hypothetical protein
MCPACVGSATLVAGGVISSGGLTALVVRIFRLKTSGRQKTNGPKDGLNTVTDKEK